MTWNERWTACARWTVRATLLAASMGACAATAADAPASPAPPPNLVVINERLVTSGQPSAEWLETLKAQGFEADIYLVPATVPDAVAQEPLIVSRQGLVFVNIPIRFDGPTEADFDTFAGVLTALGKRKVLVHCQVNLRASSMVFLYRTVIGKEDPQKAYEAVSKVWSPEGPWRRLIEAELKKHAIDFEMW